jgi:hypothetical protein
VSSPSVEFPRVEERIAAGAWALPQGSKQVSTHSLVVVHVTVVFGPPSLLALQGAGCGDAGSFARTAWRWRHPQAARPDELSAGMGRSPDPSGRYGLLQSRFTLG